MTSAGAPASFRSINESRSAETLRTKQSSSPILLSPKHWAFANRPAVVFGSKPCSPITKQTGLLKKKVIKGRTHNNIKNFTEWDKKKCVRQIFVGVRTTRTIKQKILKKKDTKVERQTLIIPRSSPTFELNECKIVFMMEA